MDVRRVLVTGGAGFIGNALVRALLNAGHQVAVLDNLSRGASKRLDDISSDIEFFTGDIRDSETVQDACRGRDTVCHLAYINGTKFFYEKPDLVLDVAVRGMLNVMDACGAQDVKDFILASSSEVYQSPPLVPTPEAVPLVVPDPLNPRYSYGGGKLICELMALHWASRFMNRVVVFRPHNVYGPDMGHEHVIPELATRAAKLCADATRVDPIDFKIKGDGGQTRAFVHISDFTIGLMKVIEHGQHKEIYHIGNPEETSIADLARKIIAVFGRTPNIIPGQTPAGETSRRVPDISKLRALGYEPRISLDQGLSEVVRWYAERI